MGATTDDDDDDDDGIVDRARARAFGRFKATEKKEERIILV